MTRTRASAKQAGSSFERLICDYLARHIDDRIDRRVKNGAKDRGDVAGLRVHGRRVVGEAKNTARVELGSWIGEAHTEMRNDDAIAGVVFAKRHGKGAAGEQWVHMTVADFVAIVTGIRPEETN